MAEELRDQLEGHAATTVMNGNNFGPVTLFAVYPDGVDTFSMPHQERTDRPAARPCLKHNEYNRRIFELIRPLPAGTRGRHLSRLLPDQEYGERSMR
jgi:hypothetical protein